MKKHIVLIIAVWAAATVTAQVKTIIATLSGDYAVVVQIPNQGSVTVDSSGRILEIHLAGEIDYYSDFNSYEAERSRK